MRDHVRICGNPGRATGRGDPVVHKVAPRLSIVREISVRCQVSGKALAAGITASLVDQEPAASAVPLTYFSNDAKHLDSDKNRF